MTRAEKAVGLKTGKNYNCCQSVLCACCDLMGLDEKTAASLGYGFAGGMHRGEVCGAVTGGLMAIGAACLPGDEPTASRPAAVKLSHELEEKFEERHGSLLCRDILAANGRQICPECIATSVSAAEEIIAEYKANN